MVAQHQPHLLLRALWTYSLGGKLTESPPDGKEKDVKPRQHIAATPPQLFPSSEEARGGVAWHSTLDISIPLGMLQKESIII
jgi:hypothetical protein